MKNRILVCLFIFYFYLDLKQNEMLRITIDSNKPAKLSFGTFEKLGIPAPPQGIYEEINGDLILIFEDEPEAIMYYEQLENLSLQLDNKSSPENLSIGEIIIAIRDDEFVQTYLRQLD
jgi:hypothetical protein